MAATWTAPKTWADGNTIPEADLNTHVRDNLEFLKIHIALEEAAAITVVAGVLTVTQAYHKVAGELAADDTITDIAGGAEGDIISLRPNGNVITLANGGNLSLGFDVVLPSDSYHVVLQCNSAGDWIVLGGKFEMVRTFLANAFQYPAPGTDWTPQLEGAGLGSDLGAKKVWIPFNFLKIGDGIISYKLVGDAIDNTALTLDCKLVSVDLDDPLGTTNVPGGNIAQINIDGDFDAEKTLTAIETVVTDKQYVLEILGTTDNTDEIYVMGAEVLIRRLV